MCILLPLVILITLSACASATPLPTLNAHEISSISKSCQDLADAAINAWESRQAETLRQVYTDDIVHYDGSPLYTGIDDVIQMAKEVMGIFGASGRNVSGQVYISKEECVDTWIAWGYFGFSQDNPGTEYDLLQFRDGKISFWRLFYDPVFIKTLSAKLDYINVDLLSTYSAAWSAGDTRQLLNLYSDDVRLDDTLFGYSLSGKTALKDYIGSFLAKSPGATWELGKPFAERQSGSKLLASHGGVFGITVMDSAGKPCTIEAAILLTPNEASKISAQKVFYDADTLITCGWAK